jgi:hypothetical protein
MGIGRALARLLEEENARRPFSGRICTLGRMTVNIPERPEEDDVAFFRRLGFAAVESVDYSDFEGATHVADLNRPLPADLVGRFDVVLDSGTLEHVFNFPVALKNLVDMARANGRVIICAPSSNYMDHGFYMFSPTLFFDYCAANAIEVETCRILRHSLDSAGPWRAYDYTGEDYRKFFVGALRGGAYLTYIVARKTPASTSDRIPQQRYYADAWQASPRPSRRREGLVRLLRRVPFAMSAAMRLRARIKRRGPRALRDLGRY